MNFDQVRVPKEIKQKETIFFHIPFFKIPITTRQIYFFIPGLFIGLLVFFLSGIFKPRTGSVTDTIKFGIFRIMLTMVIPVFSTILSMAKRNGRYLDEVLLQKAAYRRKSAAALNEKALKALKAIEGGNKIG